jgi:hypothetical protein
MVRANAFLTGRVTFEQLRGYWPEQTDDPTGVSAYLNQVQKYVRLKSAADAADAALPDVVRGF